MELTISQRKTYKIKYQFVIYTCIISFLFSLVRIDTTCLLFTLPFFYLCFLCGYYALLSYSIGMIISILFFQLPDVYKRQIVKDGLKLFVDVCLLERQKNLRCV